MILAPLPFLKRKSQVRVAISSQVSTAIVMLREYKWEVWFLLHSISSLFYIITVFEGSRSYHGPGHAGGGGAAANSLYF